MLVGAEREAGSGGQERLPGENWNSEGLKVIEAKNCITLLIFLVK